MTLPATLRADLSALQAEAWQRATALGHDLGWWQQADTGGPLWATRCQTCGASVCAEPGIASDLCSIRGPAVTTPCPDTTEGVTP